MSMLTVLHLNEYNSEISSCKIIKSDLPTKIETHSADCQQMFNNHNFFPSVV